MWQTTLLWLFIAAATAYLLWYAYRLWRPRKGASCPGGCCSQKTLPKRESLIRSDDLVARLKARR